MLGLDGNDTLDGGYGDDRLIGGAGNDVYRFNTNNNSSSPAGNDVIENFDAAQDRNDVLMINTALSNIQIIRVGEDLRIGWVPTYWAAVPASITVASFYAAENARDHRIDKLIFPDTSFLTGEQLAELGEQNLLPNVINGTELADSNLAGTWRHDVITGLGGDDTIVLSGGGDTAIPGTGADYVVGSAGGQADTLLFSRGDGQDVFRAEAQDGLRWQPGVLPADIVVRFVPVPASNRTDLVLSIAGTTDSLTPVSYTHLDVYKRQPQAVEAAKVYSRVRADNPSAQITLTGHSLGGGLASIVAVWFDVDAVVFDEAPFELTARNPIAINGAKVALLAAGLDLGCLLYTSRCV